MSMWRPSAVGNSFLPFPLGSAVAISTASLFHNNLFYNSEFDPSGAAPIKADACWLLIISYPAEAEDSTSRSQTGKSSKLVFYHHSPCLFNIENIIT